MCSLEAVSSHHKRQHAGMGLELSVDASLGLGTIHRELESDFVVHKFWDLGKLSFLGAKTTKEREEVKPYPEARPGLQYSKHSVY